MTPKTKYEANTRTTSRVGVWGQHNTKNFEFLYFYNLFKYNKNILIIISNINISILSIPKPRDNKLVFILYFLNNNNKDILIII